MSIIRTVDRSTAYKVNGLTLRRAGATTAWPAAPEYIATSVNASLGTQTLSWPTVTRAGDLAILCTESSGIDTPLPPTGFTEFSGMPLVDVADITGSAVMISYRFATADDMGSYTVPDPGDHHFTRLWLFRNVSPNAIGRAVATSVKSTASTTITWPAITTPSPNNLVIFIASRPDDNSSAWSSSFVNSNLTGVVEVGDSGTTTGDGGALVSYYGFRSTPLNIGTSTATSSLSTTNTVFVLALEPDAGLPA